MGFHSPVRDLQGDTLAATVCLDRLVVKGVGEELVDMDRADRWDPREADHLERVA